eukprot:6492721-Amphidinium_carterae.3
MGTVVVGSVSASRIRSDLKLLFLFVCFAFQGVPGVSLQGAGCGETPAHTLGNPWVFRGCRYRELGVGAGCGETPAHTLGNPWPFSDNV